MWGEQIDSNALDVIVWPRTAAVGMCRYFSLLFTFHSSLHVQAKDCGAHRV